MYLSEERMDYFLIKMHWNYFEHNDLLHRLNEYKISRNEHQVVDFWVTDELSASEVLFWECLEYVPWT